MCGRDGDSVRERRVGWRMRETWRDREGIGEGREKVMHEASALYTTMEGESEDRRD